MSTLHWLGIFLALTAGGGIGWTLAERHRQRPRQLTALRTGLQVLLTEIDIGLTPLPQALARAASAVHGPVAGLFLQAARHLQTTSGITGGQAWAQAVAEQAGTLALDQDEIDILLGLSACLGGSSREDQRRHLLLAAARLDEAERRAQESWRQQHRLALYLGFVGAAIAILVVI